LAEKCPHHDDLKAEVDKQAGKAASSSEWQAAFSEKMGAIGSAIERNTNLTDEVKRCVNDINLALAKEYVTKADFNETCNEITTKITGIHARMDSEKRDRKKEEQARKEYNVRVLAAVFVGGGLLFAFIAWVVDMIRDAGVL
jgi:hypothetical protein